MSEQQQVERSVSPHPGPLPRGEGEAEAGVGGASNSSKRLDVSELVPEWHPMLPNPTAEEVATILTGPEGAARYAEFLNKRKRRLELADEQNGEPFYHGFEPEHWAVLDAQMRLAPKGVYNAGGKRATKSERAAKRFVQAAMAFERGKLWAFQGNEKTSISMQQQLVWRYLPNDIKALNASRRSGMAKVNYSQDGGFTEGVLVLPNRTEVYFLTYKMDHKAYQGWEIGAYLTRADRERMHRESYLENLGAWLDEDAPLAWVETCEFRCATRSAKVLWTFSTMNGITTAVKEVLGTAKTLESRPAELLSSNRVHVEGCPKGEMPFIQVCGRPDWRAVYFHTVLNRFGKNYENVKGLCQDKPFGYVAENAYGWSDDTMRRQWPTFGPLNVIEEAELPAEGTNYMFTDPAGGRMWASLWVRVGPGNPPSLYIYRDWPDERRFGAWAVPSSDPTQADGDAGPAQKGRGYGFAKFKEVWLTEESFSMVLPGVGEAEQAGRAVSPHPGPLPRGEGVDAAGRSELSDVARTIREFAAMPHSWEEAWVKRVFKDPQRVRRMVGAIRERAEGIENGTIRLQENIFERYIDPRAGRNQHTAEKGGTCAMDELDKVSKSDSGEEIAGMRFFAASGVTKEEGIAAVNELLYWNKEELPVPIVNYPRLFVVRHCRQVIWALENYTDTGGEMAGCKDFADLLRYMALARLRYVGEGRAKTIGGGAY